MSGQAVMYQSVQKDEVQLGKALPYSIYTAYGGRLAHIGRKIEDERKLKILQTIGWRKLDLVIEEIPGDAVPQEEAIRLVESLDKDSALMTPRGRPPLYLSEALIVDDMQFARKLLADMLFPGSVKKIYSADDGDSGVLQFFAHQPHLVFLDIDMPGQDGLSVLKQIKSLSPETFVCMVSANASLLNVKEAKAIGVNAFLVKPISGRNLKRVLAMYVPDAEK